LDGLAMATRPGSIDPGIITYLLNQHVLSLAELADALAHDSGLKGLAGGSGDIRAILDSRDRDDPRRAHHPCIHERQRTANESCS